MIYFSFMSERIDGVLVHLYKFRRETDEMPFAPRNTLQLAAVEEVCKLIPVSTVFVAAGYSCGRNPEPLADRIGTELVRRGVDKHTNIVSVPAADSTDDEVDLFMAYGKQQGWETLSGLGTRDHAERIGMVYAEKALPADIIVAETILEASLAAQRSTGSANAEADFLLAHFANARNTQVFRAKESVLKMATNRGWGPQMKQLSRTAPVRIVQRFIDG